MKMMVKIIFRAVVMASAAACLFSASAFAATGLLRDTNGVLADFFPGAQVERTTLAITPELGARLKARLGYLPAAATYTVYVGRKDGAVTGYAIIDDEKGMHEPITFAVLVAPDGTVAKQEVMVYREPEGDGVTQARFARQFVGKTVKDPIKTGVDIQIVSSATISSNSMAIGVKRAVALVTEGLLTGAVSDVSSHASAASGSGGDADSRAERADHAARNGVR